MPGFRRGVRSGSPEPERTDRQQFPWRGVIARLGLEHLAHLLFKMCGFELIKSKHGQNAMCGVGAFYIGRVSVPQHPSLAGKVQG